MNTDKMCHRMKILLWLTVFFGTVKSIDQLVVLTEEQRIELFGTNSSENLPHYDVVRIELLNSENIKSFRKRLPNILQYRTSINDEVITFTVRPNNHFIAPGCLVHHYQKNGNKLQYPCFTDNKESFYTGRSLSHNDSWVAVSVRGGLRGVIVYGNTSLMVSPLRKVKYPDQIHETDHVIYRYQGEKHKCSTKYPEGQVLYPTQIGQPRQINYSGKRYIEISVVIDPPMMNFHGLDLDKYAGTALHIASRLYTHQKTGQDVELVVTSIIKKESYNDFQVDQTKDANKMLSNFCSWKERQKDISLKTDATVFLTKIDIEQGGSKAITGLANPRGMCKQATNCALVEDSGVVMGYTIAHEIGHLLSMKHDGPNGDTDCGSSIMNVAGASGRAASTWSSCSKQALTTFLSSKDAKCLLNKPPGYPDHYSRSQNLALPGVIYPADQQCKFVDGPDAQLCPYKVLEDKLTEKHINNTCEQLICKQGKYNRCYLYSFPLLDGTDINNTRTWCQNGEPVAMTDGDKTPPVHGVWSDWTAEWTTCSRTCGGGVKLRRRECNNPKPQYAGRQCNGSDVLAVMCNFQKCIKSYKETQCSDLDSNHYGNMTYTHVPVLTRKDGSNGNATIVGDASCKVYCEMTSATTSGTYVDFQNKAYADGTDCSVDHNVPFTRCIDGKCREFGCDGHLDSGLKFDKCGKCNGTGKACTTVKGTFHRDGPVRVFETVLTLSRGSTGIKVNQTNMWCFLSVLVDGERVFNKTAGTNVFDFHGVRIQYSKSPQTITIDGPLPTDVKIQVYRQFDCQNHTNVSCTPEIGYEYNEKNARLPESHSWSVITTQCSKSCGTGESIPIVKCRGLTGPVHDSFCDIASKPDEIPHKCNQHYCPPRWNVSDWSKCSVPCGQGIRNRSVACVVEDTGELKPTVDSQCSNGTRPSSEEICDRGTCPDIWIPGNWNACSVTCGTGVQYRNVYCYDPANISTPVSRERCLVDERPDSRQICKQGPCRLDIVGGNCTNINADCRGYGSDICVGIYKKWAYVNCARFCGICDACEDEDNCVGYFGTNTEQFCREYPGWTNIHCRRGCKYCTDECSDVSDKCNT